MKLNGFVGKGSGKLGASVFAISGGEQIVRQYNPQVANPNTDAQVTQRAKLKLMSQLAAALSSALAFRKDGLKSARNLFVSKNIGLAYYEDNSAKIDVTELQLTESNIEFPEVGAVAAAGGGGNLSLESAAPSDVSRVIYVVCQKTADDKLVVAKIEIANNAGSGRTFATTTTADLTNAWVFAYGVKDLNASAKIKYEEYVVNHSEDEATLLSMMRNSASGYGYTKTTGVKVTA